MRNKGKLYLIPIPISEGTDEFVLPTVNARIVGGLRFFVVEKTKTARQFLRRMDRNFPIDESEFFELDKHNAYEFKTNALKTILKEHDIGLMSEAGYPGVADPGSEIVRFAHENDVDVVPLIGPSSLLLALAASGMNGQGFTFNGYLPKKDPERATKIKEINQLVIRTGYAQLFIETPYRNTAMMTDLLRLCNSNLSLTVAYDITGKKQYIKTKKIAAWKKSNFKFEKYPCVFVLGN